MTLTPSIAQAWVSVSHEWLIERKINNWIHGKTGMKNKVDFTAV